MRTCQNIFTQEVHSADGLDFIDHKGERSWVVVWRGVERQPILPTRELARRVIRGLKRLRAGTQLVFDFAYGNPR